MRAYELYKKKQQAKSTVRAKIDNSFLEAFVIHNNVTAVKIAFYIAQSGYNADGIGIRRGDLVSIRIDIQKLCQVCGVSRRALRDNIERMMKTTVKMVDTSEEFRAYQLIPSVSIVWGEGIIDIEMFSEVLLKLVDVTKRYTLVDITNLMRIRGKHALRMLQLLEQIAGYSESIPKRRRFVLEELNLLFGTNYRTVAQFIRAVIEPAKSELDSASRISFVYETVFSHASKGRPKAVGVVIDLVHASPIQPRLF